MPTFYFDLTLGSGGSGTAGDPYGSLTSIVWQDDLTVLFAGGKRHSLGTAWAGIDVPTSVKNNLRFGSYGSDIATLHGTRTYSWTVDSGQIYKATGVSTTAGVVLQNSEALKWVEWVNYATSTGNMVEGSYTYDYNSNVIYVWANGGGNPGSNGVEVSVCAIAMLVNGVAGSKLNGYFVEDLRLEGFSRNGGNITNVMNAEYRNITVRGCGGDYNNGAGYHVGGGLQCSIGTDGALYEYCDIFDVYDSPLSPQLYSNNGTINNITFRRNRIGGGALAGVECALWNPGGTLSNVLIEENYIYDMGSGFSGTGDNTDKTVGIIFNRGNQAGSTFSNIIVRNNEIHNSDYVNIYINSADTTTSSITIDKNIITGGRYGIYNNTSNTMPQRVIVTENEIRGASIAGIRHDTPNSTAADSDYIRNSLLNNGTDNMWFDDGHANVQKNICSGATNGIRKTGPGTITEDWNNVYGATSNFNGLTPGANSTQIDPQYESGTVLQIPDSTTLIATGSASGTDLLSRSYVDNNLGCYATNVATASVMADLSQLTT